MGPIILTKFVRKPFTDFATFDYPAFIQAVELQVRALDNVLDLTLWPLPQQQAESASKRRIGVGFTGLGNALAMMGISYASKLGRIMAADIAHSMRDAAYTASVELAKERGAFPLFNAEEYLKPGTFASRLPESLRREIAIYGIRNSHLLSIAPTGTTSLAFADNASNGIEPPFSLSYDRRKRNGDGTYTTYAVLDHGLRVFLNEMAQTSTKLMVDSLLQAICENKDSFTLTTEMWSTYLGGHQPVATLPKDQTYRVKDLLPSSIETALEMSTDDHLLMMQAVQPFIDSAISKTVNVPAECTFEDFKLIYDKAHKFGLKGVATYRPNSILGAVLSVPSKTEEKKAVEATVTSVTGVSDYNPLDTTFNKRPEGDLKSRTIKVPYHGPSGDGSFYVSISFIEVTGFQDGTDFKFDRPIEIFVTVSPGGVPAEWVAAYSRNLSLLARSSFTLLVKALQDGRNISSDKGRIRYGWYNKADGTKVPRYHASEVACIAYAAQEILTRKGLLDEYGTIMPMAKIPQIASQIKANESPAAVFTSATQAAGSSSAKVCPECGSQTLSKRDGCETCSNCGHMGSCG